MWVARDKNGILRLFSKKPFRCLDFTWITIDGLDNTTLDDLDFPEFKERSWESEPIWVDLEYILNKFHKNDTNNSVDTGRNSKFIYLEKY